MVATLFAPRAQGSCPLKDPSLFLPTDPVDAVSLSPLHSQSRNSALSSRGPLAQETSNSAPKGPTEPCADVPHGHRVFAWRWTHREGLALSRYCCSALWGRTNSWCVSIDVMVEKPRTNTVWLRPMPRWLWSDTGESSPSFRCRLSPKGITVWSVRAVGLCSHSRTMGTESRSAVPAHSTQHTCLARYRSLRRPRPREGLSVGVCTMALPLAHPVRREQGHCRRNPTNVRRWE
mmetsp:Transcript_25618/g.55491  ORF Transcript_25618/g.55491 Transcript_25618/m.55491 type:complete len:233 (+) Transcript_25618:362-1060(+)